MFSFLADSSLAEAFSDNTATIAIFVAIIVAIFLISIMFETIISKSAGIQRKSNFKVNRMVLIAMLSAMSVILNLFSFKIPFLFPSFYKIDFAELPALIGAFALGPIAGTIIETIKILLNIVINGTSTAFVGEIANFVMACALVIPAGIVYYHKRTKKGAMIGLCLGVIVNVIAACLMNAYVLLPAYSNAFHMDMDTIIGMGTSVNSGITGMTSFIMLATAPFNLIKSLAVGIITALIYKPISRFITAANDK